MRVVQPEGEQLRDLLNRLYSREKCFSKSASLGLISFMRDFDDLARLVNQGMLSLKLREFVSEAYRYTFDLEQYPDLFVPQLFHFCRLCIHMDMTVSETKKYLPKGVVLENDIQAIEKVTIQTQDRPRQVILRSSNRSRSLWNAAVLPHFRNDEEKAVFLRQLFHYSVISFHNVSRDLFIFKCLSIPYEPRLVLYPDITSFDEVGGRRKDWKEQQAVKDVVADMLQQSGLGAGFAVKLADPFEAAFILATHGIFSNHYAVGWDDVIFRASFAEDGQECEPENETFKVKLLPDFSVAIDAQFASPVQFAASGQKNSDDWNRAMTNACVMPLIVVSSFCG